MIIEIKYCGGYTHHSLYCNIYCLDYVIVPAAFLYATPYITLASRATIDFSG